MLYINKITNDAMQQLILTGIPRVRIPMTLRFMPRTQRWEMGVQYNDISIQGVAVVCSLNLLYQFRNIIPFGIACVRADGLDPYTIDDFVTKLSNLYLLDQADMDEIQADWFTPQV